MVIIGTIQNYSVKRILVNQGSSADTLYSNATTSMGIKKSDLKPHKGSLISFSSKHVLVEGLIRLRVTLGIWPFVVDMDVDFLVVDALNTTYNVIMRRTSLNRA